jgi:serine/threonine-protein kinase
MTQAGLILGTAAYMSPEQAKGRNIDKRTDVWAFGCVLYEMLTARRAFDGEDVTDTIAAVVRGEPDWNALPKDTPAQVALLLKRCLEKERRARIADISVVRFLLNERLVPEPLPDSAVRAAAAGDAVAPGMKSRALPRLVAAAVLGVAVGAAAVIAGGWALSRTSAPLALVRFTILPPAAQPLRLQGNDHDIAMAPDGSYVVYRSGDSGPTQSQLMIRPLNELEARVLPGTSGARFPFISPDGRWVGFQVAGELRKVAITGGSAQLICKVDGSPRGASWGDDDFIVFGTAQFTGLQRVAASGGEPKPLTTVDAATREVHGLPHVLPHSQHVLFTAYTVGDVQSARVESLTLATGERRTLVRGGSDTMYVDSGHLIYATADAAAPVGNNQFRGALRAIRFDPARAEPIGDSVPVVDSVAVLSSSAANYSVSRGGQLDYIPAGFGPSAPPQRSLVWVDRKGQEHPIAAPPRAYAVARLSPDGSRIALDVREQTNDIWIWDLGRQTLTSLNRDPAQDMSPLWMPDGKRVVWTSTRGGGNPNLYWQAGDGSGSAERLTVNQANQFPTSISPDGRDVLVFGGGTAGGMDLFRVPLQQQDRTAQSLVSASAFDLDPELSPDGRWLAYHSNESGEFQVYVRPYPNVQDGRWQISTSGGSRAAWSRNGRELFYLDRDGLLTAVPLQSSKGAEFTPGTPTRVLHTKYYSGTSILGLDLRAYDVAPDGQRFLMIKDSATADRTNEQPAAMVTVLNWAAELKARLPAR